MNANTIDNALCKNCKLCVEVCPNKIIGKNGGIHFKQEREHLCLQCGQCMAVCPSKAIQVKGLSYENDFHELSNLKIDYDGFMEILYSRRSIRTFKNKPVDDKLIDQIIDSVSYAPFGASPEKMELSIINKRETIESALPLVSDFFDGLVKKVENPIASFIVRKFAGEEDFQTIKHHLYPIAKSGTYKLENGDGITRGAPSMIIIHAAKDAEAHTNNAIIFATYIMLAAHALGLGACMVEIVPAAINRIRKLKEVFQIPMENEAVMSVIIGHPKYKYKRTIKRNKHKVHKVI